MRCGMLMSRRPARCAVGQHSRAHTPPTPLTGRGDILADIDVRQPPFSEQLGVLVQTGAPCVAACVLLLVPLSAAPLPAHPPPLLVLLSAAPLPAHPPPLLVLLSAAPLPARPPTPARPALCSTTPCLRSQLSPPTLEQRVQRDARHAPGVRADPGRGQPGPHSLHQRCPPRHVRPPWRNGPSCARRRSGCQAFVPFPHFM